MDKKLVFTGAYKNNNWYHNTFYYGGANFRYHTFNLALNLLNQKHENPIILETGCQRLVEDIGAGMSTVLFAEYVFRYGGTVDSVDISANSLKEAEIAIRKFTDRNVNVTLHQGDSVDFLQNYTKTPDLVYLDSYDYPIGHMINKYGSHEKYEETEAILWEQDPDKLIKDFGQFILPCQEHAVNEYLAIKDKMTEDTILIVDDNLFPGGGKARLVKETLLEDQWICLLDFQQSVWVKRV